MLDSSGLCKLYFETKEYVNTKYKFQYCRVHNQGMTFLFFLLFFVMELADEKNLVY